MAGGTLKGLLHGGEARAISWDMKASLAADVARGMAYMHSLGHIHRDLKSGNVLITETMQAKVAYFGSVGRLLEEQHDNRLDSRASLHSLESWASLDMTHGVGTPLYMSLEMLRHTNYDERTDVWSFGVLLWEIAAQAPPDLLQQEGYSGRAIFSGLDKLLEEGHRLAMHAEWPAAWRELMARCWQQDPDRRPAFPQILQVLEEGEKH